MPYVSGKVDQSWNLNFDVITYEFFKLYVLPVQHIKIEYQIKIKVKNYFLSDKKVAAELGPDYDPPCSQLTYKADIQHAKDRILKHRKKVFIQGMLRILCLYNFYLTCLNIYLIVSAFACDCDIQAYAQ